MTTQQAANLRSARGLALLRADLSVSVDETGTLSYADRIRYLEELAGIILTYPDRFAPQTVNAARATATANFAPLESYGVGDAYADFTTEFVAQGQAINPLSEENRGKTARTLSAIAALAAVAFVAVLAFRAHPARLTPRRK